MGAEMLNAACGGVVEERVRRRTRRTPSWRAMERARSLVLVAACVMVAAWAPVPVDAACAEICSEPVWGFGPAPTYSSCQCTYPGKTSGPNACGCGVCYIREGSKVVGYGTGPCESKYTDCRGCLDSTDSGSDSGSGKTNATTTNTPSPSSTNTPATEPPSTTLTPSSSTPPGNSSSAADGNAGTPSTTSSSSGSDSSSSSGSSSGIATWQIALIICSCVLVFAVIVSTIMSCYCRARNQMKDNLALEAETAEYVEYWNPKDIQEDDNQYNNNNGSFGPAMSQPGRTSFSSPHSRPSSGRNLPYAEPTYAIDNTDRIVRSNRQSLGSNGDLPSVFNAFPQRERPSHEVGSRKNIAIEL